MTMKTEVVEITPAMAREWLNKNMKGNRPMMRSTVHGYARIMRNGGWTLTHQGIAFDENGELIDGQHRLSAIVEANIPVKMNVTYNVHRQPGEVFTIDMGRKRSYANVTIMSGIDDPVYRYAGPFVAAYYRYKIPGQFKADPAEIVDYIERHYDDVKRLYLYTGAGSGHGHGVRDGMNRIPGIVAAAVLSAMYRGEDANALYRFCQVYRLNDVSECDGYNPKFVLNLRDYVRHFKNTSDVFYRCESTIYAFAHNLCHFRVRDNCYPFNQAMDS